MVTQSAITESAITRRKLLLGAASLSAGCVLSGCSRTAETDSLKITLPERAIPPEVLKRFRSDSDFPVQFYSVLQSQQAFQYLQRWQQQPEKWVRGSRLMPWREKVSVLTAHNLVSLSDYWLSSAIAQDLIAPISVSDDVLARLPFGWQQFVSRDEQGQISVEGAQSEGSKALWAAPYKVQSLVIVYRQSQLQKRMPVAAPFSAWRDLLSPALRDRIALPDHPNLVIGLLQKMQTGSFNTSFDSLVNNRSSTPQLVTQLSEQLAEPFAALNQQVRTYDAETALKALINEDLLAVVAWSGDVVLALQRYRDLRAVVPAEGSLLSADLWVRPKNAPMSSAAQQWISFCWEDAPAIQLSATGKGVSPIFLTEERLSDPSMLPGALTSAFDISGLSPAALQKSEPLLPLPETMQAAYFSLWQQLRGAKA